MRGRERCDKSSKRAAPSGNIIAPIFINHIHASLISFPAGNNTRRRIMTPSASVTAKRHTLPAGRKSAKGGVCSCRNLTSATDAMNTARHQTEATSSESHEDLDSSSHPPSNQTPQVSGSVVPPSGHTPARRFHPDHPGFLHVGQRRSDWTDVWLSTPPRGPSFQQVFRDHKLAHVSEEGLEFDWLDGFNANNYPGTTTAEQKEARRLDLNDIPCANRVKTTPNQSRASADPNPLRESAKSSYDGHGSMDRAPTSSQVPIQTLLVVSANNRSDYVSIYVCLKAGWTISDLFESLLDYCKSRGQPAENATTIEARFLWNNEAQLLRKTNQRKWLSSGRLYEELGNKKGVISRRMGARSR